MADLEKIADDLSALTVIEAAELSKLLEDQRDQRGSGHYWSRTQRSQGFG
jgi:ribosomal protein L7/L12